VRYHRFWYIGADFTSLDDLAMRRVTPDVGDGRMTTTTHSYPDEGYLRDQMDVEMSRPFRARPPEISDALLRPAILRRLLARFETRVVVVRASAGFGKTTALTQAVDQNRLAPRGRDVWVGCEPPDADGDHLLRGVADSLGLGPTADIDSVVDAVAAASPAQICLMFDDVHEVPAGTSGAELFGRLVADLPANGHVLLSGRADPPIALARLEAQGRVERLVEDDLALDNAELSELARRAHRPLSEIENLGGWPALVALGLRSGPVRQFLDEEVIDSLDHDQRQVLALVVALGGADDDLVDTLTGLDAGQAIGDLPMVHRSQGWYEAHTLWSEVFSTTTIETARRTHQRGAVEHLLDRGRTRRAVDLACRTGQSDLVIRALRAAVIAGHVEDVGLLRRWLPMLPEEVRRHPLALHIEGLIAQATDPTTARCLELFQRAADGYEALGEVDGLVNAIAEIGFWHHIRRDTRELVLVAMKMQELSDRGVAAAAPYTEVTKAFVGISQGDPEAILAAVRRARTARMTGRFHAITDWLEFQALELLGHTDVDLADRYLDGAGGIRGTEVIAIAARWRAGRIEELLADPDAWSARSGSDRARFLCHAWTAAVTAGSGRVVEARDHLALARRFAGEMGAPQVEITLGLPAILIEHEGGSTDTARSMLAELLDRIPLGPDTRLSYNGSGALIARYHPEALESLTVPMPARDVDLGAALRDVDGTGSVAALSAVDWPESPGLLLSALFLRTSCEFVCMGWAAGRPEARPTAQWLLDVIGDPARVRFRDHTEHSLTKVADAAKEILASVPLPPGETRTLRLLGPERLEIGGTESDHDDWRRERVRSLLGYLVVHPDATRDAIMAALWPDASEEAARRSLRSTLNLLLGVLEAGRTGGDAAYFVRADGNRVRLAGHDRLDVDVWRFDSLIDEAEQLETDGAPSLALECLRQAVELYRGSLLSGIVEGDWLHVERQRLHVRFVGAAVRAAELMLAHDRVDEAVALASRTTQIEPWSEPAHRTLVAAHLQRGDRAAAHRAMQQCHEMLEELGGPVDELTAMLERRLTGS
jgi:DNA-binding SARP family transcriptional activator